LRVVGGEGGEFEGGFYEGFGGTPNPTRETRVVPGNWFLFPF
jgi:hypothetical protein